MHDYDYEVGFEVENQAPQVLAEDPVTSFFVGMAAVCGLLMLLLGAASLF